MRRRDILLSHGQRYPDIWVREITIHSNTCKGIDLGDDHAEWFSEFLDHHCRLIRQVDALPRLRHSSALAREINVSFADGYPLLVTTEESLADLNQRIGADGGAAVPMDRFRPNIVLTRASPYEEDTWGTLHIGNVRLEGANKCVRCVITTTDQGSAQRGKEPLRTLATYRKSSDGGVEFGRNFIVLECGEVSVGDMVQVL